MGAPPRVGIISDHEATQWPVANGLYLKIDSSSFFWFLCVPEDCSQSISALFLVTNRFKDRITDISVDTNKALTIH